MLHFNPMCPRKAQKDLFCFTGCVVSDQGCLRPNNEDNYLLGGQWNRSCQDQISEWFRGQAGKWHLMGVFDGMGGGEAGEAAAAAAAEAFESCSRCLQPGASREAVDRAVQEAFLKANNRIVDMRLGRRVLGTTGTVLCTDGEVYKIYHLGDSRAYLFQGGALFPLTRDQTVARMKMDLGLYDPDAPEAEAQKHQLTQFIGQDQTRRHLKPVESPWYPVGPGDRVLLCSDGLYGMCSGESICEILASREELPAHTAALVQRARDCGGEDNITCLLAVFST